MKILILGASGQLGRSLLDKILSKSNNLDITICLRSLDKVKNLDLSKIKINYLDIQDANSIEKIFKNQSFDVLVNFLHDTSKSFNLGNDFSNNTEMIFKNIFRIIELTNPKRVIFSSSGAVYGESCDNDEGFSEDMIDIRKCKYSFKNYSSSKKTYEKKILEWTEEEPNRRSYFIFRLFSVYGSDSRTDAKHAITEFIQKRRNNKKILVNSSKTKRSFLHLDDLSDWVYESLLSKKNMILNFSSDNTFEIGELARIISDIPCRFLPVDTVIRKSSSSATRYFGSNKLRKSMGFQERRDFYDCLIIQINKTSS